VLVLAGAIAGAVAGVAFGTMSAKAAPAMLVQLRPSAPTRASAALRAAGATLAVPSLRIWRLDGGGSLLRKLRAAGDVAFAEQERTYTVAAVPTDPLADTEYWRASVHVDTLEPPGPGVPVTLVDSGVSFNHPEFAGRPNLIALDVQEPQPIGGVHGTAVASVIGAPQNGVGVVGIYPQALIRSWDASLGDGTRLPSSDIARGIVAAAQAGRSVINLSLGGNEPDKAIDAAVEQAVRTGSLVVAASGNSGEEGNTISYPGANPHVLTVGATDESDQPASFTTSSPYVDLAAPGVNITVASALDNSWQGEDGTSFSSPMVAGAAAWLWTVRPSLDASQVAEILRRSARDVATPGYDEATGWGILDVAAALAAPTPQRDTAEPNDTTSSATTATTRGKQRTTISGRVMQYEDERDVYKVWLPAKKHVTVAVTSDGVSVTAAGATNKGKVFALRLPAQRAGHSTFLTVKPQLSVRDAAYKLAITVK
jgi:subtilisin family serine protease